MTRLTFTDIAADDPLLIRLCTVRDVRDVRDRTVVLRPALRKVAAGIISGKEFKNIAFDLGLTEGTVKVYSNQLYTQTRMYRLQLMRTYYTMALQELQWRIAALESELRSRAA